MFSLTGPLAPLVESSPAVTRLCRCTSPDGHPPLTVPTPAASKQAEFEVIVMRHGIMAPYLRLKRDQKVSVKMGRQVMPYHYPA